MKGNIRKGKGHAKNIRKADSKQAGGGGGLLTHQPLAPPRPLALSPSRALALARRCASYVMHAHLADPFTTVSDRR